MKGKPQQPASGTIMIFKSLVLSGVMAATALSAQAQERVFLLQLGSFESKQEAQSRWIELQGKYPQLLEGLSVRLQDVTLPPDNYTVYRTQAGPLPSPADAQIICDRLSARQDECYVVETAMFRPEQLVEPSVQMAQRAVDEPVEQISSASMAAATAASTAASAGIEAMETAQAGMDEVTEEAETSFWSQLNPFSGEPSEEGARTPEPVTPPRDAMERDLIEMEQALEAEAEQIMPPPDTQIASYVPSEPPVVRTLRPGEGMDALRPPRQAPMVAPEPQLSAEDSPPQPTLLFDPTEEEMTASQVPQSLIEPAPIAAAPVNEQPEEESEFGFSDLIPDFFGEDKATMKAEDLPLPPPPPPSNMQAMQQVQQQRLQAQQAPVSLMASPAETSAATPAIPANAPFQIKRNGELIRPADAADVRVAEAVRVPVSEVPMQENALVPSAAEMMPLGMPSDTSREKNLWAEILPFTSQQDALAFWDEFRRANPTFPPVRVRITHPFLKPGFSDPAVTLRVGPFDKSFMIQDICAELSDQQSCRLVRDLGGSTSAGTVRSHGHSSREVEHYRRAGLDREPMYWVQVGAYETPAEARSAWRMLRDRHGELLQDVNPDIVAPVQSSGLDQLYRLRAGPFAMRPGADNLCRQMKHFGSKCRTVFTQ